MARRNFAISHQGTVLRSSSLQVLPKPTDEGTEIRIRESVTATNEKKMPKRSRTSLDKLPYRAAVGGEIISDAQNARFRGSPEAIKVQDGLLLFEPML